MLLGVDHINLVVSDLDRSVQFYTEILGFQEVGRARLEGDWIEDVVGLRGVQADVVYLEANVGGTRNAGGTRLELLSYKSPQGEGFAANSIANTIGLRHMALRVKDIRTVVKRLKETGVTMLAEPVIVPESVMPPNSGRKTLCYFLDPDGILLELAEYR